MTSTLTRGQASGPNNRHASPGIEPGKRRQRSMPAGIIGAIFALVGVLAGAGLWLASSEREAVLAVARPVKAGDVITADDLTIANLPQDPAIHPLPASSRSSVIGKTAAVDLVPNTLLVDEAVGSSTTLGADEILVNVEVSSGSAPVDSLHNGDRVRVIRIAKDDNRAASSQVITEGRVTRVVFDASSGIGSPSVVSLVVGADKGPDVAAASSAKSVALLLLPGKANGK